MQSRRYSRRLPSTHYCRPGTLLIGAIEDLGFIAEDLRAPDHFLQHPVRPDQAGLLLDHREAKKERRMQIGRPVTRGR